jgi:dissimilatory sulfite reductase (desulfoviridin) alpha/beta subunit
MKWLPEAEQMVKKVPFFVRKRVRVRVEQQARLENKTVVTPAEVNATQQRFLSGMASEIKGYQLETCFGPAGCPNRIASDDTFVSKIEHVLEDADLIGFLQKSVSGPLKFHHEFRVSVADCPNACSQPQIKDVGVIAACAPQLSAELCSACGDCAEACRESALTIGADGTPVQLDAGRCLACGQCQGLCPSGALSQGVKGYRVQLGGKLGRHPQLARELPGVYDAQTVLRILRACLTVYKEKSAGGEKFAQIMKPRVFDQISTRFNRHAMLIDPF